jgi:pimeloyl-ACP methyl ester carboxylesterase
MASDGRIMLPDGRTLAFGVWGGRDGVPVFGFHGVPNSRLVHLGEAAPAAAGVRLLLPDRPGFGQSDPRPGRRLLDWPGDVAALADALDIDRFAVFGVSAGGAYAAACGAALPGRVVAVGLVSSVGPVAAPGFDSALDEDGQWLRSARDLLRRGPEGRRKLAEQCREELDRVSRDPDGWLDDWARTAPAADRAVFADPAVRWMYVESVLEAAAHGATSYVEELEILLGSDWGGMLEELSVPVFLWHGTEDPTVPVAVGRMMADRIPDCRAWFLEGEGHLLVHARAEEILQTLTSEL